MARLQMANFRLGLLIRIVVIGALLGGFAAIVVPMSAAATPLPATPAAATPLAAMSLADSPSLVATVPTGVDDFEFASYVGDFWLDRDSDNRSTLRTQETFVAVFPAEQNRGMKRAIPNYYQGSPVAVSTIAVTDEAGNSRPFTVENDGDFTIVTSASDSYVSGAQTYVFSYEQSNVTRGFADTALDEWYWDTNGVGWDQPFGSVTAIVHLGEGLSASLASEPLCYFGAENATDRCEIGSIDASQYLATADSLAAHNNVTVVFGFESGTFAERDSSYFASVAGFLQPLGALAALIALIWALRIRKTALADRPGRPTIIAEYAAPKDVALMSAALLLGKRTKAIAAQILDFAVRNKLRIRETPSAAMMSTKPGYQLELVDSTGVSATELDILRALFGKQLQHGAVRDLTKPNQKLSQKLNKIVEREKSALVTVGLRRKVSATSYLPIVLAAIGAFVAIIFGIVLIAGVYGAAAPFIILGFSIVTAVTGTIVLVHSPVTALGAQTRDHLLGLELYIRLAEADRLRMLQSPEGALREKNGATGNSDVLDIYEKLLPYAVLFGLEKQWSAELGRYYSEQSPQWYVGTGGFNAVLFATHISSISDSIAGSYSGSASSSS
ncbi:MAG: DUF2207 domain-containing protein, partial [Rhodoglobus sp.]